MTKKLNIIQTRVKKVSLTIPNSTPSSRQNKFLEQGHSASKIALRMSHGKLPRNKAHPHQPFVWVRSADCFICFADVFEIAVSLCNHTLMIYAYVDIA